MRTAVSGWLSTGSKSDVVSAPNTFTSCSPIRAALATRSGRTRAVTHASSRSPFGSIEKRPLFEDYFGRLQARPAAVRARELDDALMAPAA